MNKIESKIRYLLNKNVRSESDDLYILSLIRKELESLEKNERSNYSDLKLFCDWALHIRICRSFPGSQLVSEIHKTINLTKKQDTDQVIQKVSKTLLVPFKEQIKTFLEKKTLPINFIDDQQKWKSFLGNLFGILEITPLIIK